VDLRNGIEILERSASALNSATLRIEYTDDVWDLFDEMIDLKLESGLPEQAWDFAERGHVQASRDMGAALGVRDVATRLPAGHALAYYVFTKTQAVLFLFDAGMFTTHRLTSDAPTLAERIRTFTGKLQRGEDDAEIRQLSEQLYDDLLAHAVDGLPDDTRIHVVADGPLHQLPFHALKARGDARYLFERFLISNAPSATRLLAGRRRVREDGSSGPVIVFGDPAGDDLGIPLPRLPYAAQEASTVAGLYHRSRLYLGEQATRDVFLHGLSTARVVHLAGHAVVDERHPELSRLILAAPPGGGPRHVLMRDLTEVPLPYTRLVVLAACSTGAGPVFKGLGALSLASPFVAAGVPTVVSTLWPIDDRSGGRLFAAFHKFTTAGVEVGDALRRAQLEVRRDPSLTPWAWAAVNMFTILEKP
jgi:CHAT domain-containing protein